ncbi:DUF2779 domain protein [Mycoplasma haemofelis Ohio2]|uniref:DUF2779 domain protein n=1 Tax=Mycoplasma haemofelis (strain Ohio2) TaxID=859194 RepID=F6FIM0_MYCHI|nr:DUF2779 domain protein [Mycoplasma haemofelis Ohio2]
MLYSECISMDRKITKYDFLNYFKKPYPLWFLNNSEIEQHFFEKASLDEIAEELTFTDLVALLKQVDSEDSLYIQNFLKLNALLDSKLKSFYIHKFKIGSLEFHDHTHHKGDSTEFLLKALEGDRDAFIYKPTINAGLLQMKPTAIYKMGKYIYLIEHSWSIALKQETMGSLAYYMHILRDKLHLRIDQIFVTHLSGEPSPLGDLMVSISNSLPYTAKKIYPEGPVDPKLKNINTFFGLEDHPYPSSLYQYFLTRDEYESFNNEEWEIENIYPEAIVRVLQDFLLEPDREVNFRKIAKSFLDNRNTTVSPDNGWFRIIFKHCLETFNFSGKLLPLHKVIPKLLSYDEHKRNYFLNYVDQLSYLGFEEGQEYIVFEDAVPKIEELKKKRVKVYYDFETLSVPFPYLPNTKPFAQIVLQLSLIRIEGDKEHICNLIIDPLELKLSDFKRIIDEIYIDEPDVAYIVYNQSFENTRLKEMAELLDNDEYREKVISIIDRTVDLANWFTYGNNPYIIHKALKGFHSIKKVINLIPEDILKDTKTRKYSDLARCQNGAMAQALLLSRALAYDNKGRDENNWKKNKEFMFLYCENDVRSMIAVERFIDKLISENKYGFYDLKRYMRLKKEFRS